MLVKLSETTYQRLVQGLGQSLPVSFVDELGFKYVDLEDNLVDSVREAFGDDIDWSINQTINHNQRRGEWPPSKTSKSD